MKYSAALAGMTLGVLSCTVAEPPVHRMVTRLDLSAAAGSMAPHLAVSDSGVLMTWIEPGTEEHSVRFARLENGLVWSTPTTVARGPDFFVNWADFPSVQRAASGSLIAHWLQKSGSGTYAYDVRLARSVDNGATWSPLGTVHNDGTETEHGFVSLIPEGGGVRAFWLDGREMVSETTSASAGHGGHRAMTLRTAFIGEGIARGEVLDDMTCECCQTGAAMTADGAIVVYRDRTESEIRDISIVRQDGYGWSEPRPVHTDGWVVPGCPVNGPAIAAGGADGRLVAVAWFTASGNRPRVQVAFSDDAGATFEAPILLDAEGPFGRVDVELDEAGDAIVSWLGGVDQNSAAVRLIRVSRPDSSEAMNPVAPSGPTPLTLAMTGGSRASGFPRMVRDGGDLVVAWTDTSDAGGVKTAVIPISGIPRFSSAGGWVQGNEKEDTHGSAGLGTPAPEYTASDFDGKSVALSEMRGQPVLLNFWATWCLPCREEIPILVQLHKRYAERGLRLVGVSLDDASSSEAVQAFVGAHRIPYLNLHDPEDLASRSFSIPMLPVSLLINGSGHIVWRRNGTIHQDDPDLERALKLVLAEPSAGSTGRTVVE